MFRIKERETIFVPQIAMNYIFFYPENKTHFLLLLYCLPLTKLKKKRENILAQNVSHQKYNPRQKI